MAELSNLQFDIRVVKADAVMSKEKLHRYTTAHGSNNPLEDLTKPVNQFTTRLTNITEALATYTNTAYGSDAVEIRTNLLRDVIPRAKDILHRVERLLHKAEHEEKHKFTSLVTGVKRHDIEKVVDEIKAVDRPLGDYLLMETHGCL